MNRLLAVISILLFSFFLNAQIEVRIGLFQEDLLNSFVMHCISGEYDVQHESGQMQFRKGQLLYFTMMGDQILMSDGDLNFEYYKRIVFSDITGNGKLRIRPVEPSADARNYEGELELTINHNTMLLVNIIDFNQYLAGVVETEGGPSAHVEFYKAHNVSIVQINVEQALGSVFEEFKQHFGY